MRNMSAALVLILLAAMSRLPQTLNSRPAGAAGAAAKPAVKPAVADSPKDKPSGFPAEIVAPIFSGGFHSLAIALDDHHDIAIYGGAASNAAAIADFQKDFPKYLSFATSSEQAGSELEWYWNSRHIAIPNIVELNEA